MPWYQYECGTCGIRFEERQHFDDGPVKHCPHGHSDVRRVYAPAGLVFKGSGWYITDSRKPPAEPQESEMKSEEKK